MRYWQIDLINFGKGGNGKPAAAPLDTQVFDDMLEELDPEFQKSLKAAANEYKAGKSISLKVYLKKRLARQAG